MENAVPDRTTEGIGRGEMSKSEAAVIGIEVEGTVAEQGMLRDSVTDFVRRLCDMSRVRRLRADGVDCDPSFWKRLADLGWLGILVPQAMGGLGLGLTEAAIVAEGLGAALIPEPFNAMGCMTTTALSACAPNELAQELLTRIVAGEQRVALAWQEEPGELDVNLSAMSVEHIGHEIRLNGIKRYVLAGKAAEGFLVSAVTAAGPELYWVPADAVGLQRDYTLLADGRHFGVLRLQDVAVPSRHRLARGEAARVALETARDYATVIAGAELMGLMKSALKMSLDYMRNREQFGKPIGSFQALQHRAVDLFIQQQLASAVLESALEALRNRPDAKQRAIIASRVKARCSDAALRIVRETIQIHGAMGFTDEFDAGLYLKRALVLSAWLGNAACHRRRYARYALGAQL